VLETKEMIGNLRAAHYHRYELPLLTGSELWVSASASRSIRAWPPTWRWVHHLFHDTQFRDERSELAEALGRLLPGIVVRRKSEVDYVLNRVTRPGEVITIANRSPRDPSTWAAGTRSKYEVIPEDYLFNSPDVRLAVLQGLLDSDGGPVTQQGRTCRIQFGTASARLRDDVAFWVQSLGGVVYQAHPQSGGTEAWTGTWSRGAPRSDAHILDIRLPEGFCSIRSARKREIRRNGRWASVRLSTA